MKNIPVELAITQVRDGIEYEGTISFNGRKLDWHMTFHIPIPRIDEDFQPPEGDKETATAALRKLVSLSMCHSDKTEVDLSDAETFDLFVSLLLIPTIEFHDHPQTRGSNEGLLSTFTSGVLGKFGATASISMTATRTLKAEDNVFEIITRIFGVPVTN